MVDIHGILDRHNYSYDDMRIALEEDPSCVERLNIEEETPLLRVLEDKDCSVKIVQLLIQYGARVNERVECGRHPLHSSLTTSKDKPVIRALLEAGANPYLLYNNRSAICYSFEHSPISVVRYLLDQGCGEITCNVHGDSLLHCAVNYPNPNLRENVLELLLERGVDVHKIGSSGQTIMCFALMGRAEVKLLTMLLDAGALLDNCTIHPSPLICATTYISLKPLSVEVIKMLLEWGACPYQVDSKGRTALQNALCFGDCSTEVIKLLMDISGVNVNECCLLNFATKNPKCKVSVLQLLLQKGARVNLMDKKGDLPLHSAVSLCSLDVIKLLIEKGSSVCALNKSGETPLMLALLFRKEPGILMTLFIAGARVGMQPLPKLDRTLEFYEMAGLFLSEDCVKLLVKFCLLENPNQDIEGWVMSMPGHCPCHYPCHDFPVFFHDCEKEVQQMAEDHGSELHNFIMGNSANSYYLEEILKVKPDIGTYRIFFDIIAARVGIPWMKSKLPGLSVYATKLDSSLASGNKKVFLNYETVRAIAKLLSAEDLLRFIMAYY